MTLMTLINWTNSIEFISGFESDGHWTDMDTELASSRNPSSHLIRLAAYQALIDRSITGGGGGDGGDGDGN